MFSFLRSNGEDPQMASTSLHNMLNDTAGLKVPSDPASIDLLSNPALNDFLGLGAVSKEHFLSDARGSIVRIFEMTQAWCEYRTHNDLAGQSYCDPEPLSEESWRRIDHSLSSNEKSLRDCKSMDVLDRFARLLLMARKDWLVNNMNKIREVPEVKLVARIHSCLMILKKRKMLGHKMDISDGDQWLDFDACYADIDDMVERCEKRYG